MKPAVSPRARSVGFTLAELMVGLAISAVVLTQILVATFALERSFAAADYRMSAQSDQLRVLDYLSRDLHMASAVSVRSDKAGITLTVPSTKALGVLELNLGALLDTLVVSSGAPSNTAIVSYYLIGNQMIRDTGTTQTVVANTMADLKFDQQGNAMIINLLFTPQYSSSPTDSLTDAATQNTRASSRVFLRNLST